MFLAVGCKLLWNFQYPSETLVNRGFDIRSFAQQRIEPAELKGLRVANCPPHAEWQALGYPFPCLCATSCLF